jgi:hypothetical protein
MTYEDRTRRILLVHMTYEDGTARVFSDIDTQNSDAGESPKRENTTLTTW